MIDKNKLIEELTQIKNECEDCRYNDSEDTCIGIDPFCAFELSDKKIEEIIRNCTIKDV